MTTTNIVGWIETSDGQYTQVYGDGLTDGTLAELYCYVGSQNTSIGDAIPGKTITRLALAVSTGSILNVVTIYAADGSILLDTVGCETTSNQSFGMDLQNLSVRIAKGAIMKCNPTD
jgi:hypothetical protein